MKYCRKIMLRLILCLMVLCMAIPMQAMAAGEPDLTQKCDLTIDYQYDGSAVAGAQFELWRVGTLTTEGDLALQGPYADYPVEINGLTDTQFNDAAAVLYSYIKLDELAPEHTAVTGEDGTVMLVDIDCGVYLMCAVPVEDEEAEMRYVSQPQLVVLPHRAAEGAVWEYAVTVLPKCALEPIEEPLELKVLKVWDDNGSESRPTSVVVHLLADGEVYDTVTLSAENDWRHTWSELSAGRVWSVAEEVPEDYTVSITMEGTTFVVTNTADVPPPPPPDIPQTGLTWWPVPVLVFAGLALIVAGVLMRKRN